MSPDELEDLAKLREDIQLAAERKQNFCSKMYYFFCEQVQPSNLETYLSIKKESGADGDYSSIDNETILRNYGIVIPDNIRYEEQKMQDDSTAANTATMDGAGAPATSLNNANHNKEDQPDESKLLLHDNQ